MAAILRKTGQIHSALCKTPKCSIFAPLLKPLQNPKAPLRHELLREPFSTKSSNFPEYEMPTVTWGVIQGRKERLVSRVIVCDYLKSLGIVPDELEELELPSTVEVMRERVEFLQKIGLTIDDINEYPLMLGCSVRKNMVPVLGYLEKIGIPRARMGEFVKNYPQCLHASVVVELAPVIKFLRGLDVEKQDMGYVLMKYPELLGFKLEGTMSTSVAYLVSIGVNPRDIGPMVTQYPSFQVLQVLSNYWMAYSSPTGDDELVDGMDFILLVYTLLAVGSALCVLLRASLVAIAGLHTAEKLFSTMLNSVLRAPMAFFDSTPTGRILNRVSTDQSVLDLEMANKLGWCAFSIIQLLGTIAVMSQVAWEVFVIFIPVTAICIWYQRYYIPTARELARLAGIERAPILHHFAESLTGSATIRAFDQQERFTYANLCLIDNHSRPWFHNVSAMEWLSFRLNQLANFVFAFSLVLLVTLPEGIINPSIAGLAVTYGINLNVQQASVIWNICNAENKMISVERILQYSNLTSEAPLVIEDSRPPSNWPDIGTICFKNLQIRYAEHLPSVLKNITCTFPGRKKVGVVGRTGSGKSTLIQAIFRVVEAREGTIVIDDVDISKIGLHDLRSRLSIIPQDPTMFEGTVRGNLDPLEQHSDNEIWEALDKCQLGDIVRQKPDKLETNVVENGENWSVGQRQLFCLGRALLKKSSILVLDEATASVDSATDGAIQKIICQAFEDRTVVTIAHRIHTVIDSDLVLVLSDGRIAEYDTPAKLLERENSFFSKLIKEYSMRSQSFNGH